MRICKKCSIEKPLDAFDKHSCGIRWTCRACKNLHIALMRKDPLRAQRKRDQDKASRIKNKDKIDAYQKNYRENNRALCNKRVADWLDRNRERKALSNKLWASNNKDKRLLTASNYRARKLNRTPVWFNKSDEDFLLDLIDQQELIRDSWGIEYHIDHIVPLAGDLSSNKGIPVCGLHIKDNWELIPASINASKSNDFYG